MIFLPSGASRLSIYFWLVVFNISSAAVALPRLVALGIFLVVLAITFILGAVVCFDVACFLAKQMWVIRMKLISKTSWELGEI